MNFDGLGVMPDRPEPMDDDLVIRQSTVESMMLCPAKVGYSTHPGFDPTPSEAMAFGSVLHAIIAEHILEGEKLYFHSADYARKVFYEIADRDGYDLDAVASDEILTKSSEEVVVAYQSWLVQWWERRADHFHPIAIEQEFIRPLGVLPNGRPVWVRGTPDVLEPAGMTDWKTAGRGWSPGKGEARIQSPTYLWLAEAERPHLEGVACYAVYNRQKEQWQEHLVPVTLAQIEAAKRTLWQYAKAIDADVFPPTPSAQSGSPGRGWWCSAGYCSAWDICEFKGLVSDGVDLSIRRSSTW